MVAIVWLRDPIRVHPTEPYNPEYYSQLLSDPLSCTQRYLTGRGNEFYPCIRFGCAYGRATFAQWVGVGHSGWGVLSLIEEIHPISAAIWLAP